MLGLMQDAPLTIDTILRRAEQYYGSSRIVTRTVTGLERTSYADFAAETRRTAGALDALGVSADGRVGSFAWNTARHLQLYFAVPCTGRILHMINVRYFPDQVVYTVDHAEDEVIFVDRSLIPVLARSLSQLASVRHVVVMDDGAQTSLPADERIVSYADLVPAAAERDLNGRVTDERTAASLCYTTGTSGRPRGALYSHRSTWLHAYAGLAASGAAVTERDNVLPVVPMFHANAWGLPYTALFAGAGLTLPGPDLSPAGLVDLMESERVTHAAGVPTIWMGILPLLRDRDLSSLNRVMCGGSAVPKALSEEWRKAIGVPITQGWGMTETSPVVTLSVLRPQYDACDEETKADVRATAGMALPGCEMRIRDTQTGQLQPWDGVSRGEVEVYGPWAAREYFKTEQPGEQFTGDGWLRTGDVGTISPAGYLSIVDRTKDLVKSGGEWISSVALENEIMAHPKVAEAAVIAVGHPKWGERPLACVVVRPGEQLSKEELLDFLRVRLTSFDLPDDVAFIDEVPKTSVGKFSKKTLRDRYADYVLPGE
jgi:fatty-acyl-CoA synthase